MSRETELAEVEQRIRAEVAPRVELYDHQGGYDCCGCSTYQRIVDDVLKIIDEVKASNP